MAALEPDQIRGGIVLPVVKHPTQVATVTFEGSAAETVRAAVKVKASVAMSGVDFMEARAGMEEETGRLVNTRA